MELTAAELHGEHADRADRLTRTARARAASAISTAEEHEKLADAARDSVRRELHHRAADCYRDAQIVHESAAALHALHADHERRFADFLRAYETPPRTPFVDTKRLEERYAGLAHQQTLADKRDETADERDRIADERDTQAALRREIARVARDQALLHRETTQSDRDIAAQG